MLCLKSPFLSANFAEHYKPGMKKPVLLIIFNRPETTKVVFNKIRQYKPTELFIAADGPRRDKIKDSILCAQARVVTEKVDWGCSVKRLYRDNNLGCRLAVSRAIDWFFKQVGEGIILEDDCEPGTDFFIFCSKMLDIYRKDSVVMHIGGDNFQPQSRQMANSYYFTRYSHIWGWATWGRAWKKYDISMQGLGSGKIKRKLAKYFFGFWDQVYWWVLFRASKNKRIDTWDYQWLYSIWKSGGISINPGVNLVRNIGFTENATHTRTSNPLCDRKISKLKFPLRSPESHKWRNDFDKYTIQNIFKAGPKEAIYLIFKYALN